MKAYFDTIRTWVKDNPAFCIAASLLGLMYLSLSLLRHWHFGSGGFDLGIFDQAIWHYSRFEVPMGTIRITDHLLADHFHPILLALAPLYWVIPRPETLLVVQNLLWVGSLAPIYLFALHRGHSKLVSLLLVLSYAFFWGITLTLNFDFHEIAFALFVIPWAIYLIEIKKWIPFWIGMGILLLTKEEMGFVVAFFGVYLAVKGYWKQGIVAFLAGTTWFALATQVFIKYFAGPTGGFGYWTYSNFGSNPFEAIKSIASEPVRAIGLLFTPEVKANTLKNIFMPWMFLPLVSPIIIIGLPLILQRFWSDQSLYWLADFHYTGTLSPILAMGAIDTLARIKNFIPNRNFAPQLVLAAACLMLIWHVDYIPQYQLRHLAESTYWQLSEGEKAGYRILKTIPQAASVSAQNSLLPHLSQRDYAYLIHNDQPFYYSQYIVFSAHPNLYPFETFEEGREYIESKLAGKGYQLIVNESGWLIWNNPAIAEAPIEG